MRGIPTLLSGNFRQILPVIHQGTRADIVHASIKSSPILPHIQLRELQTDIRAQLTQAQEGDEFADLLLRIGNGEINVDQPPDTIVIPPTIGNIVNTTQALIESIYGDLPFQHADINWLSERAILAPLNESVTMINEQLVAVLPGNSRTY